MTTTGYVIALAELDERLDALADLAQRLDRTNLRKAAAVRRRWLQLRWLRWQLAGEAA